MREAGLEVIRLSLMRRPCKLLVNFSSAVPRHHHASMKHRSAKLMGNGFDTTAGEWLLGGGSGASGGEWCLGDSHVPE